MKAPCQNACSAWVDADDLPCLTIAEDVRAEAVAVATDILFERSGRKYAGSCQDTVRVLRQSCACGWPPCTCGHDGFHRVTLGGYPVTSIIEVRIAGEVLDAALYEIDDFTFLKRKADPDGRKPSWPFSEEIDVTFTYGVLPASDGIRAAKALACEFAKLWGGDEDNCKLPPRTRSIARQGVGISFEEVLELDLGLPEVELFLEARNPQGKRRQTAIVSPDIGPAVRRINT